MFPKSASNNLDSCCICLKKFEKRRLPALCYFMLKFREQLFCSLGENLPPRAFSYHNRVS